MLLRSTVGLILIAGASVAWAFRLPPVMDPPPPSEAWLVATLDTGAASGRGVLTEVAITPRGLGIAPGTERRYWLTSDSGRSWSSHPLPLNAQAALGASISDNGIALVTIANGRIARSTDGGASWALVRKPGDRRVRLSWIDEQSVLAVGTSIIRSDDSGATWSEVAAPKFIYWNAAFSAAGTGILVGGDGAILRSTDRGTTWTQRPRLTRELLRDVAFADPQLVIAVGTHGTILRSIDGGEQWTSVASGTTHHLLAVAMADARVGIAVGFYGTILRTVDGGATWNAEASGTRNHLMGVALTADRVPVAVGFFDTILRGTPLTLVTGAERPE